MLQHTRRSEDNSVGSVLSLHLYMGCGDLIQVMRFVGQAPLPTATLKLQVTKYCKKKKKKNDFHSASMVAHMGNTKH